MVPENVEIIYKQLFLRISSEKGINWQKWTKYLRKFPENSDSSCDVIILCIMSGAMHKHTYFICSRKLG